MDIVDFVTRRWRNRVCAGKLIIDYDFDTHTITVSNPDVYSNRNSLIDVALPMEPLRHLLQTCLQNSAKKHFVVVAVGDSGLLLIHHHAMIKKPYAVRLDFKNRTPQETLSMTKLDKALFDFFQPFHYKYYPPSCLNTISRNLNDFLLSPKGLMKPFGTISYRDIYNETLGLNLENYCIARSLALLEYQLVNVKAGWKGCVSWLDSSKPAFQLEILVNAYIDFVSKDLSDVFSENLISTNTQNQPLSPNVLPTKSLIDRETNTDYDDDDTESKNNDATNIDNVKIATDYNDSNIRNSSNNISPTSINFFESDLSDEMDAWENLENEVNENERKSRERSEKERREREKNRKKEKEISIYENKVIEEFLTRKLEEEKLQSERLAKVEFEKRENKRNERLQAEKVKKQNDSDKQTQIDKAAKIKFEQIEKKEKLETEKRKLSLARQIESKRLEDSEKSKQEKIKMNNNMNNVTNISDISSSDDEVQITRQIKRIPRIEQESVQSLLTAFVPITVESRGNCGFNSVAFHMYEDAKQVERVRRKLKNTLYKDMTYWADTLGNSHFLELQNRLEWREGQECPVEKWFDNDCLALAAAAYEIPFIVLSDNGSVTKMMPRFTNYIYEAQNPPRFLWHTNGNHYQPLVGDIGLDRFYNMEIPSWQATVLRKAREYKAKDTHEFLNLQ